MASRERQRLEKELSSRRAGSVSNRRNQENKRLFRDRRSSGRSRSRLAYYVAMRYWLLTNTTYGTWLPGDERGSVTSVREDQSDPIRLEHDLPGEPWEDAISGLQRSARELMQGPPIFLDLKKADALLAQFQETAACRGWQLKAVAVMKNHFHLVVAVVDDPEPRKILADFKAYGTRKLNALYGAPPSKTWWTTNGSKRKLKDEAAIRNAINYVLYKQLYPLVVWSAKLGRIV